MFVGDDTSSIKVKDIVADLRLWETERKRRGKEEEDEKMNESRKWNRLVALDCVKRLMFD